MSKFLRLDKFLAEAGVCSRRAAVDLVESERVRVNGLIVREKGAHVEPGIDEVAVNGRPVVLEEKVYFALHKPHGYLSTMRDPHGRPTVADLLRDIPQRVFPVGRLDRDSEGLLIVTNDGPLAYRLTHPKFEMPKTYLAHVEGTPTSTGLANLRQGVLLDDGPTAPAQAKIVGQHDIGAVLELTIHEGRKREVRRMCEAIGCRVLRLVRTAMANVALGDLAPGSYRPLSESELEQLQHLQSRKKQ